MMQKPKLMFLKDEGQYLPDKLQFILNIKIRQVWELKGPEIYFNIKFL